MPTLLTDADVIRSLRSLHPAWTGSTEKLARSIEFADFGTAVAFVNAVAPICERLDHHPDMALRWRWVDVVLTTHSAGGVTDRDVVLANEVDEIVATLPLAE